MAPYHDLHQLSETDLALKEHMHRFAKEVLRPSSMTLDRMSPEEVIAPGSIYWDVWRQAREMGLHRQNLPASMGGAGFTALQACIVSEEQSWGSVDWAVAFGAGGMPYAFCMATGNQRLIKEFAMPYYNDTKGEYIGCWGITEPAHGSDVGFTSLAGSGISFDTKARKDGDSWVITGQKSAWVSNGTVATHALTIVSVEDKDGGEPAFGSAIVPLDLPGITRGKPLDKIGQRALNQGEIYYDDVRIPLDQMIVIPRLAQRRVDGAMGNPNTGLGMAFVGVARAAFEETLDYCKNRIQGGKPLVEHQLVQRKLFDMFIKVETARAYARQVVLWTATNPLGYGYYGNASKIYVTQAALEIASEGVQLHGGMGLCKGMVIEKLLRDARAGTIEDGANDSLALMVAPGMISTYAY